MPQRPLQARDAVAAHPKRADASFASSVCFRTAREDDLPGLTALVNASYAEREWRILERYRTDEDDMRATMRSESSVIIAEVDGVMAGTVTLTIRPQGGYFGLLAVAAEFQGRGLASLIIDMAEQRAREAGCDVMSINCVADAGMPPFYRALGYRVTKEETSRHFGAKRPFTLMELEKDLS